MFFIILLGCVSICLCSYSIYMSLLFFDEANIASVLNWIVLTCIGFLLLILCIIGFRGASSVNLELLLTFFWGMMIFIAPIILGVVSCFDFYTYIELFLQHGWQGNSFQGLRELFCNPSYTASNKCLAPLSGNQLYPTTDAWCLHYYNATDCSMIRSQAISDATRWASRLAFIQAFISIFSLVTICLILYMCYRMLTAAVVTQSMNDIINYLLIIPIGGCAAFAWYMTAWLQYGKVPYRWSSRFFGALAISQAVVLPIGILAGRQKSYILLTIYIILLTLITGLLFATGILGLFYAGLIMEPTTTEAETIACFKGMSDCCCCDLSTNRCPEWTPLEVRSLLVLDLKLAGSVALINTTYLIGALIVASFVRNSLQNYKYGSI